ncbi:ESX secretion-associated protein EspG [Haloechinothrix sp. LS1_15]|uniref:ESX secretion-associated protein EspG n=1 Tax=Haloechinothrix sp. LS1_15 TaxID=2652248 RepID=UPI0029442C7C|nr:ESX secretion-associated protein EspG [Haloechinothrix sp. LS1_15]MDV6011185.1 ESX secretion-associated protein EspG [Haloechinothrix sp. LS1_15]
MTAAVPGDSVVLSALEFDVAWEQERLPSRHAALSVPSPGTTHSERAELVERAWHDLTRRGLVRGGQITGELLDMLAVLAQPAALFDTWVWADRRISAVAASTGTDAILGVVDGDEVWLIPVACDALASAAVSVAGKFEAGPGQSVTLPYELLREADAEARGDPHALVTALADRGVELWEAQEVAGMFLGTVCRCQIGAERHGRQGQRRRGARVVAFHDTDAGRYLFQVQDTGGERYWSTLAPASNQLLTERAWELLDEV